MCQEKYNNTIQCRQYMWHKTRWKLLSAFVCIVRRRFINIIDVNDISIKPYKEYKENKYSWTDKDDSRKSIKGFGIICALKDYEYSLFGNSLPQWFVNMKQKYCRNT